MEQWGVLGWECLEEGVEVLDGVKKPPFKAVENSLTGATTQTLTDTHFWPMGLDCEICASGLCPKYIFSFLCQEFPSWICTLTIYLC